LNRVANWATNPEMETSRKPFIRKFYGEKSKYQVGSDYRSNRENIYYIEKRMDYLKENIRNSAEDKAAYVEFKRDNLDGIKLINQIKVSDKLIGKLRDNRTIFYDREEQIKVDRMDERIRLEQAKFNKKYNQVFLNKGIASKFDFLGID